MRGLLSVKGQCVEWGHLGNTPSFFGHQATRTRATLRIANPTRNTAASNAASGKNLAITKPTPRNTEEITMAVRSDPIGECWLARPQDAGISLGPWLTSIRLPNNKPLPLKGGRGRNQRVLRATWCK